MHFSVLPPEVNSTLLVDGNSAGTMWEAAAAWDGIGSGLSAAANEFSSVTADLTAEAWQGPAAEAMRDAVAPYVGWLGAAAAQAERSATQARSAASAYEEALTAIVHPGLVAANRTQLVSLVKSNLFGQNAPWIAAAEAAYEQMWAHDVAVMGGYHASVSAAIAQLGSWEQAFENLPGLPGRVARAVANGLTSVSQGFQPAAAGAGVVKNLLTDIFGSPPSPPIPASQGAIFVGTPSLGTRFEVAALSGVQDVLRLFGVTGFQPGSFSSNDPLISVFISDTPPKLLPMLFGETVQHTTYNGMSVVQITPAHPSGKYVVAVHGGGYDIPPSIFHWYNYTLMAHQTGATIEVPIYQLVQNGGTAGTVVPAVAGVISMEIGQHGASNVSVYGDSAGGQIALSAVESLVSQGQPVPASMVLMSPRLAPGQTNPNVGFVHDPLLLFEPSEAIGKEWAGNLPLSDPLVTPLNGSLSGLPQTYVYSGSLDSLGPDVVVLQQEAAAQGAPISFVLANGEIHDFVLLSPDGSRYLPQIYRELGI
jgi:triacylglycerol lipase